MPERSTTPSILMPTLPDCAPLSEVALFAFDDWAFPFRHGVETHLLSGRRSGIVLGPGPEGSHDEIVLYYGTVIRIGDTFHMWYNGNYGPEWNTIGFEREKCVICYATSADGVNWQKPDLGLVEFNGSKHNNIVDFPDAQLWSTCAVLYDPEDPDPDRRYKMAYEAFVDGRSPQVFCVAFSSDGLHWRLSERNPVGPFLEMSGVTKHRGLYYVNGQGTGRTRKAHARRLHTHVSADFEHWSPVAAVGLDRGPDVAGPSTGDAVNQNEEIHLGAGLWHRGNVILGIYGQWHGHFSGDRRFVTMDLGLAISHDALHFYEPIPGFRIVPAREQPDAPVGFGPALMQGQGMENVGDKTLYWYSNWRGTPGSGVRMASWERDRLGMIQPFVRENAQAATGPIQVQDGVGKVYVNASGLGEHSRLRIAVVDEGFRPVPGYGGADAAEVAENGFRVPVQWKGGSGLLPSHGRVRLEVRFEGVRPEDCRLHAAYVGA